MWIDSEQMMEGKPNTFVILQADAKHQQHLQEFEMLEWQKINQNPNCTRSDVFHFSLREHQKSDWPSGIGLPWLNA